jgi:hypothetical protein
MNACFLMLTPWGEGMRRRTNRLAKLFGTGRASPSMTLKWVFLYHTVKLHSTRDQNAEGEHWC